MFELEDTWSKAPSDDRERIARRRQRMAMCVAGAIVFANLIGTATRPRFEPWPIAADDECRDRVAAGVNVNAAEWPALAQLPGIGEGLARRIVAYREERREASGTTWEFSTAGELQSVRGIGPKTVRRIAPFVRLVETGSQPRAE